MRYVFALLVCLSLPACAHSQSADATTPSAAETAPHILTTKELKAAVPGHSIGRASAQAAGASPVTLSKGTRQLSTAELNAKLVGFKVERVIPPEMRWLHPGEYFYENGKYILYGHQEKSTGSYAIRDHVVCTKVESEAELCRFIFVDVDGLFWVAPNKIYPDQFRQIRFKTIEEH